MTANIDVSELLSFCHTKGYKFYPTLIYCVTKVLNRIDNFKMFKDTNNALYDTNFLNQSSYIYT